MSLTFSQLSKEECECLVIRFKFHLVFVYVCVVAFFSLTISISIISGKVTTSGRKARSISKMRSRGGKQDRKVLSRVVRTARFDVLLLRWEGQGIVLCLIAARCKMSTCADNSAILETEVGVITGRCRRVREDKTFDFDVIAELSDVAHEPGSFHCYRTF